MREGRLRIHRHFARSAVDLADHVLEITSAGPQKLAGLPVERVNDAGLAGDSGHHFAPFARLELRIDPGHLARIGRDRRVDQQALERMIEIPVIDDVLVIPDDFAGIRIDGQRAVVIQVLLVIAGQQEFGRGRSHRGSDIEQVQLRVVARRHPGAHVLALFVRDVAPGFVAGLARFRNGVGAPQFFAGLGVMRGDDAGLAGHFEFAAARRKRFCRSR